MMFLTVHKIKGSRVKRLNSRVTTQDHPLGRHRVTTSWLWGRW